MAGTGSALTASQQAWTWLMNLRAAAGSANRSVSIDPAPMAGLTTSSPAGSETDPPGSMNDDGTVGMPAAARSAR
jgi:hypothetical protein